MENEIYDYYGIIEEDEEEKKKEEHKKELEEYAKKNQYDGLRRFQQAQIDFKSYRPIKTGYDEFDEALGGGLFDGFYVVGGQASVGKTTFALNLANNIAMNGSDVLYFPLEMSENEMTAKSLSKITAVKSQEKNGNYSLALTATRIKLPYFQQDLKKSQIEILRDSYVEYDKYNNHLYMYEPEYVIDVNKVIEVVKMHKELRGQSPVVIIDYLQLLAPCENEKYSNEKQVIDDVVLKLKHLSRDEKIPVIAISSLNRTTYSPSNNNKGKISMASFKESGSIEYTASHLIVLEFKNAGNSDYDELAERSKDVREIKMIIQKNRYYKANQEVLFDYIPMFDYYKVHKGY